jgi:membrane protease YdiL (CAAX protease family)
MKFIEQGTLGQNKLSHYLFTILIIISGLITIGQLPHFLIVFKIQNSSSELLVSDNQLISKVGLNMFFMTLLFPFLVGLLAVFMGVKYLHRRSVLSLITSRTKFDFNRFFFSFGLWGGVSILFLLIMILTGSKIDFQFDLIKFIILFFISLSFLPIQTFFEEIFFRGYLLQGTYLIYKKGWVVVLFTGILFGILHGANPEIEKIGKFLLIYYIESGIFLGLLALFDEGLELSLGYHTVNNVFAALILTNDWQAFHTDALFIDRTPPSFGVENILTLVVFQPILLLIFAKKYKWKNLKDKLFK